MSTDSDNLQLPSYDEFIDSIAVLPLITTSPSHLHGLLCGYLCAGAASHGESYLRALSGNKKDEPTRQAMLALFAVYSVSQQHITHFDFEFALLIPDDSYPLAERAKAFSEWCEGFIQGLTGAGIVIEQLYEEDAQEAFNYINEFAELDSDSLDMDEEDEKALSDIYEYARMAVLRLHADLIANEQECTELLN